MSHWPRAGELCAQIRAMTGNRVLLGFSRGKDAIAAAIELRRHFEEIVPVYFDTCPGLEFTHESIDYFERTLFHRKIWVLPHPAFVQMLQASVFQGYEDFYRFDAIPFPDWKQRDLLAAVSEREGLPKDCFQATGVRAFDNLTRRTAIAKHGPITRSSRKFHPVWDWNKARLIDEIVKADIKLPVDYRIWGRTFDGLGARWVLPMREPLPEDFARVCEWFPLIQADILRYERIMHGQGQSVLYPKVIE